MAIHLSSLPLNLANSSMARHLSPVVSLLAIVASPLGLFWMPSAEIQTARAQSPAPTAPKLPATPKPPAASPDPTATPLFSSPPSSTSPGSKPDAATFPTPAVPGSTAPNSAAPKPPSPQPVAPRPTAPKPPVASPANPPAPEAANTPPVNTPPLAQPVMAMSNLRSANCSNRALKEFQPGQAVAIGRENYTATFYLEGTATQPGFLTCGLTYPNPTLAETVSPNTLGSVQQVNLQFGLVDTLPSNSRATVSVYTDGKLFRSVTLRSKQPVTLWAIPVKDKKSLTVEVACPGNCTSRVHFTQAEMEIPVIVAAQPPAPPVPPDVRAEGGQPQRTPANPETRMRRVENTLRILNLMRFFIPF
jgi:hypothetical protein